MAVLYLRREGTAGTSKLRVQEDAPIAISRINEALAQGARFVQFTARSGTGLGIVADRVTHITEESER